MLVTQGLSLLPAPTACLVPLEISACDVAFHQRTLSLLVAQLATLETGAGGSASGGRPLMLIRSRSFALSEKPHWNPLRSTRSWWQGGGLISSPSAEARTSPPHDSVVNSGQYYPYSLSHLALGSRFLPLSCCNILPKFLEADQEFHPPTGQLHVYALAGSPTGAQ